MMKKLVVLMMVLGTASAAMAIPVFEVDPTDAKDSYSPSDWITINIVDNAAVTGLVVDAISDGGAGGMAGEPQVFNASFTSSVPGALNSNGQLVEYFFAVDTTVPTRGATGILYSFEYHVPDVPYSTQLTIGTLYDDDIWLAPEVTYADGGFYNDNLIPVTIHVIPEPATIALLGLGGLLLRYRKK